MNAMSEVMRFEAVDGVGVMTIDKPPVNAIGLSVREGLWKGLDLAQADDSLQALVLICAGRTFIAGADLTEHGKLKVHPTLPEVQARMSDFSKPIIAAIHGTALGGGLEVALCCHYRIAVPSSKAGLPEVNLGILPGAGGTQRLTRIVGVPDALELMTSGRQLMALEALEYGIFDRLASEGQLREDAIAYAREIVGQKAPLVRVADREDKIAPYRGDDAVFDEFRARNARKFRGFDAPEYIIRCVHAAVNMPFDEGLTYERGKVMELLKMPQSRSLRHIFFAERSAAKVPGLGKEAGGRTIAEVGVVGAGTMGGGIAMNFLNIGLPVTLVEQDDAALERGIGVIRRNYENSARRGKLSTDDVEARMALINGTTDYGQLASADLIVEAVFETMELKQEIFARLDGVAKAGAILASNTSFLDIDQIAAATRRPGDVLGLHFFSPANVMPLLEIVRGEQTADEVLASSLQLAKRIGKVPVVSGVCHGFIANRAMTVRRVQADKLCLQGVSPDVIDRIMYDFGFAMGPFQMKDLVGLDVTGRDSDEKTVASELVARGRLGQKQGGGYYDYDEQRRGTLSPVALEVIESLAAERGIAQIEADEEEILARLLYPVVNEGARILDEGIAIRASDIDVACVKGYNWPSYTGGPMYWADTVGLSTIVSKLRELESEYGDDFAPSALLVKLAEEGGKLSAFRQ